MYIKLGGVYMPEPKIEKIQKANVPKARAIIDDKHFKDLVTDYKAWVKDNGDAGVEPALVFTDMSVSTVRQSVQRFVADLKEILGKDGKAVKLSTRSKGTSTAYVYFVSAV